jgi:N-acetylglucosamine kinase-like BadF-type ATPase
MSLVVGVDGGNTKTVALVCDLDGRIRGRGRGQSSNWEGMGFEKAAAVIGDVAGQALAMTKAGRADIVWMHMALAGMDWPEDETKMRDTLAAAGWECGMSLENDAFSAVRACAPGGCGIGVTAGTGVASGIIRPDGGRYFYGAFTDLGGGRDIDPQTLHAVVRAVDGRGPATKLTGALLQASEHVTVTDLVYAIHRQRAHLPHGVTRRVLFSTAAQGDPVAVGILTRFAAELALCATNLMHRYHLEDEVVPVVAAGSLFQKTGPLLFDLFRESLGEGAPKAVPILADQPPLMGAVRGALKAVGHDEAELWERIRQRAEAEGWLRDEGNAEQQGDDNGEE